MEYVVFVVVMAGLVSLFLFKGLYDQKKSEKQFKRELYEKYGVLPKREYKPGQFLNISRYFFKHNDGFCIDEVTWNDLNMDEIFNKINYTYSASGEEYLYYVLRRPCLDEAELASREKIIEFFRAHPDDRVAYQVIFNRLGRTGKFSIYDYLDYLDGLGERSNLNDYIAILLFVVSLGVLFINLPLGVVAMMCILVYNNVSYFKVKAEIEPYITSFAYVFRMLDAVKELSGHKVDILDEEIQLLQKNSRAMGSFKRGSFLVMSGGRMSGSSSPIDMVLDFLRMGFHIDLMKFNQMLSVVRKHVSEIDSMITILGKVEAMIAIGAYRQSLNGYCIPEFSKKAEIIARGLYHPLIAEPVENDIETEESVLITGSNASGKSTFLKTMAINGIFAQTIHTCLAEGYKGAMFRIVSSMSLKDDLQGGESYYMVEIKSLKRILDLIASGGEPILCFVDEVLRGTNTVERIAASTQILRSLSGENSMCFAATHDIELTHLLEDVYKNYHFSEEIAEDDISFSYKIMEGRATTRNAIKLLDIMGYDSNITKEAENMAANFLQSGVWQA